VLEGPQRARRVDVDHDVELLGEVRVEVVARALRLGTVDHADRALQPGLAPHGRHVAVDEEREARHAQAWKSAS
jgi:hypothetical protein